MDVASGPRFYVAQAEGFNTGAERDFGNPQTADEYADLHERESGDIYLVLAHQDNWHPPMDRERLEWQAALAAVTHTGARVDSRERKARSRDTNNCGH